MMEPLPVESKKPYELSALRWPTGEGDVQEITPEEALGTDTGAGLVWLRVIMHSPESVRSFLTDKVGVSSDWAEHATSSRERPRLHERPDALLLVTHAPHASKRKVYFDRMAFYLRGSLLVSVEFRASKLVNHWYQRCDENGIRLGGTPGEILATLLDAVVDDYYPIMDELTHQLDQLETQILAQTSVDNKDILRLKRRLLETRRHIAPTRDILNGLLRRDVLHVSQETKSDLQDVYDHSLRILEQVDLDLDLLSTLLDTHLAVISNRLGYTTQLLTVFATVLMSVSLVAGIYGMNFKHMPELDSPWGYPFAIGLMLVITGLELWYFRKKKWF